MSKEDEIFEHAGLHNIERSVPREPQFKTHLRFFRFVCFSNTDPYPKSNDEMNKKWPKGWGWPRGWPKGWWWPRGGQRGGG